MGIVLKGGGGGGRGWSGACQKLRSIFKWVCHVGFQPILAMPIFKLIFLCDGFLKMAMLKEYFQYTTFNNDILHCTVL